MPNPRRTIRPATVSDVPYLVHLQRRWANNLGFLPRCTHERYAENRQCILVFENDEPAGYLNWTLTKKGLLRIIQVAIEPELLRTTLGTKVLRHIERAATKGHCSVLRLMSRSDLPANRFWPIFGFAVTATYQRPTTRGLPLIEWTKQLLSASTMAQTLATNGRTKAKSEMQTPHVQLQD